MVWVHFKPVVINGLRKFKIPPSWLVILLVVPFNKLPLFSKDLTTFIISFTSLFAEVNPAPNVFLEPCKTFLSKLTFYNTSLSDTFFR